MEPGLDQHQSISNPRPPSCGGAFEATLSMYLENRATTLGSREQLPIAEFAEALLVIPKVLAVNAANKDATDLVSKLRANHYASQMFANKQHLSRLLSLLHKT